MNSIDNLREITDQVLCGLTADASLKHRILSSGSDCISEKRRFLFRPVPVLALAAVLLVVSLIALNGLRPIEIPGPGQLHHIAAGQSELPVSADSDSVIGLLAHDVAVSF